MKKNGGLLLIHAGMGKSREKGQNRVCGSKNADWQRGWRGFRIPDRLKRISRDVEGSVVNFCDRLHEWIVSIGGRVEAVCCKQETRSSNRGSRI